MAIYIPGRGDVIWLPFDPQLGREQAGTRPAIIVSPLEYNEKVGLALICPITSRAKGYPFEVPVPDGFPITGVVLADQVKSLDWQVRRAEFVCTLPEAIVIEVVGRLKTLIE